MPGSFRVGCHAAALFALSLAPASALAAEVDLPRFPSVSPDGATVVFSWRGDLWSVASDGGQAIRLTAHPADESRSAWSPDGGLIAFESDRDGPRGVYTMKPDGTDVRRVSNIAGSLTLSGFTAGGDALLVSGFLEGDVYRGARPYTVPVEGGPVERLHDAFGQMPAAHAGGEVYVFERGGSRTTRRHYRGPDDRDLFLYDAGDSTFTRLTEWAGNDNMPVFLDDDTVAFLSDRADMTVNVWALDLGDDDSEAYPLTNHTDRDAHGFAVSADGSTIVFAKWDGLYVVNPRGKQVREARRLEISAPDDGSADAELRRVNSDVSEARLSPDGKTMAFVAFGDVFVRSMDDDSPTRRVTEGMARERDIAWSPDNGRLYFVSDEEGTSSIYAATVELTRGELKDRFTEATTPEEEEAAEEEPVEEASEPAEEGDEKEAAEEEAAEEEEEQIDHGPRWADALRFSIEAIHVDGVEARIPAPSPDGTKLAFRAGRGSLHVLDLVTGDLTELFESWDFGMDFRWSPDGEHIAFHRDDENFNSDIYIVRADGSAPAANISKHPDNEFDPRWSGDGKILAFLSERVDGYDAYMVMLDRDLEALTDRELQEYFEEQGKAARKRGAIDPIDFAAPEEEAGEEQANEEEANEEQANDKEAAEPAFTDEDLADAYRRLRRVSSFIGNETQIELLPSGETLIVQASGGAGGRSGLYTIKYNGADAERLMGTASIQHLSADGKTLVTVSGGRASTVGSTGGSTKAIGISAETRVDRAELYAGMFEEMARTLGMTFYHNDMKGLDWERISADYKTLAVRARTPGEFAWVASYYMGELNASHLGVSTRGGFSAPDFRSSGRLAIDAVPLKFHDAGRTGAHWGYEVQRVLPLAATDDGEMGLMPGDTIVAIDFEPFGQADTLDSMLAGKVGDEVVLTVRRLVDGEEVELDLLRTPISTGAERSLRYDDWQRSRAARVDELSGGRLGYLHIRAMGTADLIEFERDLYAAAYGKDGLIIDVRSNGGGWTTDRVLASIMYPTHAYTIPRGADPIAGQGYPRDRLYIQRFTGPINMLCNEKSFSNAEIISHAFKTLGRGTLVGQETYGGVISTGRFTLLDGSTVRQPFRGWYLPDGQDMENYGAVPDIIVEQTPEDEAEDADEQLKAAVADLMKRLD